MILAEDEAVLLEYEEDFDLLYYERRDTCRKSFRETNRQVLEIVAQKQIRFWLINIAGGNQISYEDQIWLLEQLDLVFEQNQSLEKVALVPPHDTYELMTAESILEHLQEKPTFELQYFSEVAAAREWLEESFREICFFDESLDIEYDTYHHWIYANWKGSHDFASVKRGCELIMDLLAAKNCFKLLNDNRQALGTWTDAGSWVAEDWFPRLEKIQVKAVAWILSPSTLHRMGSLLVLAKMETNIQVEVFKDPLEARQWLQAR